ncbi:phosphoribosylanthranilate isomerase [Sphingomonas lenta]|uniref:phosphoribosylanthranilate isomerase n=1 Tax=Sphingomonas lenta TaxID=1141887 RepID=UPI0011410628
MRTRLKVCCIASADEAWMAIQAGADALGLVANMPSGPGTISDDQIATIAVLVPPPVASFLLTSEISADAISAHVRRTQPSTVQVVSHIAPAESARLALLEPHVRRVQVIHVEDRAALDLLPTYSPHVHAFLLDSGRPNASVAELGGTGRAHDWEISAAFVEASPRPVFLAGGLTADNVGRAIDQVQPYGLDVCSGVRTYGRLDPVKLTALWRRHGAQIRNGRGM